MEATHATDQGFAVGVHASLQINPYYGKTSNSGLVAHFNTVMRFGPTFIYNVPPRTGQDIQPAVIEQLAGHPHFVGVKECVGNNRIEQYTKQNLAIWSGNDDQSHDARSGEGRYSHNKIVFSCSWTYNLNGWIMFNLGSQKKDTITSKDKIMRYNGTPLLHSIGGHSKWRKYAVREVHKFGFTQLELRPQSKKGLNFFLKYRDFL